jgi:hypothetical protein
MFKFVKQNYLIGSKFAIAVGFFVTLVVYGGLGNSCFGDDYSWSNEETPCCGRTVPIGTLTSADYAQDEYSQYIAWEIFKSLYGLSDYYWMNQTKRYNCHSYVFAWEFWSVDGEGWLNYPSNCYVNGVSGCIEQYESGSILSNSGHTCYTSTVGKCGNKFLCYENDLVYGVNYPTQHYRVRP